MVAETSGRGSRLFPEIRIQFASRHISLPPGVQIAAVSSLIAIAAVLCHLSIDRIMRDRLIADREAAVIRAVTANSDLQQELASLAAAIKKLQQVSADRDKAVSERDRLRAPLAELGEKHTHLELRYPQRPTGPYRLTGLITFELAQAEGETAEPLMLVTDAPPEADREARSVAEMGRRAVVEFRRLLASTGLNIERLFPQFAPRHAEGGPFVPPPKADQADGINQDQLEAMRSLMRSLPLAVPLDQYQLESRFGPRRDPFNRRASFHTGIDLSGPYMSPVYATAGGVVTYAGWRSEYGKVVEIAHGNGIVTLYGHLHRPIVSVGQTVAEHTQIGLLGSTGRSSGPHVHYEILVNDEPHDPEKFIGLARVMPAAAER
jgi:murein DD-endopeptidase MepM/ murein hydrolase activator NlpD